MRPSLAQISRRGALTGALALSGGLLARPAMADALSRRFKTIEKRAGGRLGLCAQRRGGREIVAWRANERFLMCSTFKALAVSAVLARVDRGQEHLDRRIPYGPGDLQSYAPVTRSNLAQGGMSLDALCAAAVELSDNTAANLILASLGGPSAVTGYVRALGDDVTRLDRTEPTLNDPAPPGDRRDTTTPASMIGLWRRLLLGDALSSASRARLMGWLDACETGPDRLTAITPPGWSIGHKTGTGPTTLGDVAIMRPPVGAPILMAVYFEIPGAHANDRDDVIAQAGRLALRMIGAQPHG